MSDIAAASGEEERAQKILNWGYNETSLKFKYGMIKDTTEVIDDDAERQKLLFKK